MKNRVTILACLVILTSVHNSFAREKCSFVIKTDSLKLEWTAFKTTKKVPVKGSFTKLSVDGDNKSSSIEDLMTSNSLKIESDKIDTGNPGRDIKLVEFFIKKLAGPKISGKLTSFKDETSGSSELELNFNSATKKIPVKYAKVGDNYEITGELNLTEFGATAALGSLNQECHDLHAGDDKISKTWDTVEFKVIGALDKVCKKDDSMFR